MTARNISIWLLLPDMGLKARCLTSLGLDPASDCTACMTQERDMRSCAAGNFAEESLGTFGIDLLQMQYFVHNSDEPG